MLIPGALVAAPSRAAPGQLDRRAARFAYVAHVAHVAHVARVSARRLSPLRGRRGVPRDRRIPGRHAVWDLSTLAATTL